MIFTVLMVLLQMAQANTFNFDSRKVLAAENPTPWGAVGILYGPQKKYCTAFLIGPDLLATTASCVADRQNQMVSGDYAFKPGVRGGKAKSSAKATPIIWGDFNDSGKNWAILRLDRKLGDRLGWFGVGDYQLTDLLGLGNQHTLFMVGYSQDAYKGAYPVWQKDCGPKDIWNNTVLHDCSAIEGAAGSPIFMFKEVRGVQTTVVIAIHVGERRKDAKTAHFGVPYSPEVANAAVPSAAFIEVVRQLRR